MESLTLVLLRRPANPPALPEDEQDRIQKAHLTFLDHQRKAGIIAAAGPFRDRTDETLRGLCIYRTNLTQAHHHAATDPAVQAGLLQATPITWWFREGEVHLAGYDK